MTDESERRAFEAWAPSEGFTNFILARDGGYRNLILQTVWKAWQARAAQSAEPVYASADYEAKNPLGGPAKMFDAIAGRLRAGEEFYSVMNDYGIRFDPPPPAKERT